MKSKKWLIILSLLFASIIALFFFYPQFINIFVLMPIVGFLWLPNLIYEGIQRGANMMVPILLATLAIILTIFGIKYRKSYAGKLLIAIGLILWLVVGFIELLKHQ